MSSISVYAFEDHGDESATEYTTMDFSDAKAFAKEHEFSVIEREYEYSDSTLVADFRKGHDSYGISRDGHVCGEDDETFDPHNPRPGDPGETDYVEIDPQEEGGNHGS